MEDNRSPNKNRENNQQNQNRDNDQNRSGTQRGQYRKMEGKETPDNSGSSPNQE